MKLQAFFIKNYFKIVVSIGENTNAEIHFIKETFL